MAVAVSSCRYDRIYIGAGCPSDKKEFFFSLLSDTGIMVVPVDDSDCLVKIRRQCRNIFSVTHISHVHFAPLLQPPPVPRRPSLGTAPITTTTTTTTSTADGATRTRRSSSISSVPDTGAAADAALAPLVRLPPLLWAPVGSRHKQFPKPFRDAVFVLLLASRHSIAEVLTASPCM